MALDGIKIIPNQQPPVKPVQFRGKNPEMLDKQLNGQEIKGPRIAEQRAIEQKAVEQTAFGQQIKGPTQTEPAGQQAAFLGLTLSPNLQSGLSPMKQGTSIENEPLGAEAISVNQLGRKGKVGGRVFCSA